ncbi:aspartyl-phosphate phosphatase Spo0E family protein [Bacillus sp. ISL-18]|uniref:aspartyl-phosphate phosphatase Spo0E family protein n=1 Tax=Bacillus sp. ISL-18 TaxID=2819118 RepID=UPI001BE9DADE|nr:aspartyl-phosphate phosphatase Spo0E family protein [Bacillus sp. ISL-18]MBT2659216.1 aspartyl-phosphate phosphatase Spo0E family protein [Bacillus sp. ISL-18]
MPSSKCVEKSNLIQMIELLRQELTETGLKEGFTSKKTIELSQKLDSFITRYQGLMN